MKISILRFYKFLNANLNENIFSMKNYVYVYPF